MTLMVFYTPGRTTPYPEEKVENGVRFYFLGGAQEVGNVGCIVEDNTQTRVLIDYGLSPGDPPTYPQESPPIDAAIITHAHLDHIGMVPWITASHNCPLHATHLTAALADMMWQDTYKISKIEGYPLPWDRRDIEDSDMAWETHSFDIEQIIGAWKWKLLQAGHVPGAAMVYIETTSKKILWSGDIDTRNTPNVSGAQPVDADILVLEGTYGGREHPDRLEEELRFVNKVKEVVSRGGLTIVPAFASGRGQDILRLLHKHAPHLNVHYDGMGKRVTRHWMNHPEFIYNSHEWEKIWSWVRKVGSKSDRKKALSADVIVTTSGMLKGGPVLWYLNRVHSDPNSAVLITGYQAEETGGRMLLETGKIPIYGDIVDVNCEVDKFQLSNHAGHSALVDFARKTNAKDVILFHLPDDSIQPLKEAIEKNGQSVHVPQNGQSFIIE